MQHCLLACSLLCLSVGFVLLYWLRTNAVICLMTLKLHGQNWSKVLDKKSGKYYFWNTLSNEVQWHKPFDMGMDELDDADDMMRGTGIESHDYKILEAPAGKEAEDFFEGTEDLAQKIQLVSFRGRAATGSLALSIPSQKIISRRQARLRVTRRHMLSLSLCNHAWMHACDEYSRV